MKREFAKVNGAFVKDLAALQPPSITGFTRLETQPTTVSLKAGLQAPVADPLWMLARQWQFNEFQGEDAGTPLSVRFEVKGVPVRGFRPGAERDRQPWQTLAPGQAPIETRVEAEPAWRTHPRLRGEAGLQLLRRVDAATRTALLQAYALALPPPTDGAADAAGLLWSAVLHGRTVDADALARDLAPLRGADGALTGLPPALAGLDAAAQAVIDGWLRWRDGMLFDGAADNPSWQRDRFEYAFALGTGPLAPGGGAVQLAAAEYTDGHVDWDDFRAQPLVAVAGEDVPPEPAERSFSVARRHPTPVRYPGMPADRYWEFEDGNVNFAGAEAGATDLMRLSVTEFALTFGNDWFMVPVRLPVGGLYHVARFEVVDSFGIVALAGPVATTATSPWRMFEVTAAPVLKDALAHTVFLPDSLDGVLEGEPLEHTLLARDEMANLAWAIEKKVQGVSGEPLDRDLEAKGLAFQQQLKFAATDPQIVYRLATPVPANWTPLLPVRRNGLQLADPLDIQLERAGMKRFYPAPAVLGADDPAFSDFLDGLDAQPNFISP
ncbi:MAG: hypothetical protein JWQ88_2103, partial [Rhodoferax sp.]|nr:hypothetical protein [Rhodoferax sp.]